MYFDWRWNYTCVKYQKDQLLHIIKIWIFTYKVDLTALWWGRLYIDMVVTHSLSLCEIYDIKTEYMCDLRFWYNVKSHRCQTSQPKCKMFWYSVKLHKRQTIKEEVVKTPSFDKLWNYIGVKPCQLTSKYDIRCADYWKIPKSHVLKSERGAKVIL